MKKMILMALLIVGSCSIANAQYSKEEIEQREHVRKQARKEISEKASKEARKEAKSLTKEGWKPAIGELPIDKQIERAWELQLRLDDNGEPAFFLGNGTSHNEYNQNDAERDAIMAAQVQIAEQIVRDLQSRVEQASAREQISPDEVVSFSRVIANSQASVQQQLKNTRPIVKIYRKTKKGGYEVQIRLAMPAEVAKNAAKSAIRTKLIEQANYNSEKLDKDLFGW